MHPQDSAILISIKGDDSYGNNKERAEIVWHFADLYLLLLNYLPKIMEDKKFRSAYENLTCVVNERLRLPKGGDIVRAAVVIEQAKK